MLQSHNAMTTQRIIRKNNAVNPRQFLEKIVINSGVGRLSQQPNFEEKILPRVKQDIAAISGQMPHVRRSKKSIAGFKMREGQIVGVRATLRGKKMVAFFNRLIMIVLPRVRDFRGINPKAVDAGGVLSLGLREQLAFNEINPEESTLIFPFEVSIVPRRKDRAEALAAYRDLGVPLKKQ